MPNEELPSSYKPFGHIVGRVIKGIADTLLDPNNDPEAIPVTGSNLVGFTSLELERVEKSIDPVTLVRHEAIKADLDSEGRLSLNDVPKVVLWPGIWRVSALDPSKFNFESFLIELKSTHTKEKPMQLWGEQPYQPPKGSVIRVLPVPDEAEDGQVLVYDEGVYGWASMPPGKPGPAGPPPVVTWVGDQLSIEGQIQGPHLTGPQGPAYTMPDTGWIDGGPQLQNGWTAAGFKYRRIGQFVQIIAVGVYVGNDLQMANIPPGFRGIHTQSIWANSSITLLLGVDGGLKASELPTGDYKPLNFSIVYICDFKG